MRMRSRADTTWEQQGWAAIRSGRWARAAWCFHQGLQSRRPCPALWLGLARSAYYCGDYDAALQALAHAGAGVWPQCLHGEVLLKRGAWAEGWAGFRRVWDIHNPEIVRPTVPRYEGEPLTGKTLSVYADQFGESEMVIIMPRLMPRLQAMGATLILVCHPGAADWLRWRFPETEVRPMARVLNGVQRTELITGQIPCKGLKRADYWSPVCRLPAALAVDPETLEGIETATCTCTPEVTGYRPKVGLLWRGAPMRELDHIRSLQLSQLAPLLDVPGIDWYSLQSAAGRAHADAYPQLAQHPALWQSVYNPFAPDYLALMGAMDLIIAVENSRPLIAAAILGTPVWLLMSRFAPIEFLYREEDCPWLPSLRIVRQPKVPLPDPESPCPEDNPVAFWPEVIGRAREMLMAWRDRWKRL
jgi:hypothetical protein